MRPPMGEGGGKIRGDTFFRGRDSVTLHAMAEAFWSVQPEQSKTRQAQLRIEVERRDLRALPVVGCTEPICSASDAYPRLAVFITDLANSPWRFCR
jgi:hypothetical protein